LKRLIVVCVLAVVLLLAATPIAKVSAQGQPVYSQVFTGSSYERGVEFINGKASIINSQSYPATVFLTIYDNNTLSLELQLQGYVNLTFTLDIRKMINNSNMVFIYATRLYISHDPEITFLDRFTAIIYIYPDGTLSMRLMERYIDISGSSVRIVTYTNFVRATSL
jgi:hypothetical protein